MILKRFFISLFILLLFYSCYNTERPEKPKNLLSKEKMAVILIDVAIMNSAKSVNRKRIEDNGIVPEDYIYKAHNIDSATFAKSNDYYAYDIKAYEEIYDKVSDSLNKLKEKYAAILDKQEKEKKKKDSLKKLKSKKNKIPLQKIKMNKAKTDNSHEEE